MARHQRTIPYESEERDQTRARLAVHVSCGAGASVSLKKEGADPCDGSSRTATMRSAARYW
jgi:hypothetical protein